MEKEPALPKIGVILCTCPKDHAKRIAQALLEEHLVACVNIIPEVSSHYWWEGKICSDAESLLVIKTQMSKFDEVEKKIKLSHPYQVPEVIMIEVENGFKPYLEWVARETKSS